MVHYLSNFEIGFCIRQISSAEEALLERREGSVLMFLLIEIASQAIVIDAIKMHFWYVRST